MARSTPTTASLAANAAARRHPWQAMGANALTEAARVDVARLGQLGYVVQPNPNGTLTFWHPAQVADATDDTQRQAHIQYLLAVGALRNDE